MGKRRWQVSLIVFAGGRKRKLYRLKPGGTFHVRFQVRGKDVERSTGTTIEAAAKERAKQIVEAEIGGDFYKSQRAQNALGCVHVASNR